MTPEEALARIGESTGAAVAGALEAYCPGAVSTHAAGRARQRGRPGRRRPAARRRGRRLLRRRRHRRQPLPHAAARGARAGRRDDGRGPERRRPGSRHAADRARAVGRGRGRQPDDGRAAAAASTVLGQEVEIAAPETRVIATLAEALVQKDSATSVVSVSIDLLGHPCRLVQLVPHAFVVRMTRALDDLDAEFAVAEDDPAAARGAAGRATPRRGLRPARRRRRARRGGARAREHDHPARGLARARRGRRARSRARGPDRPVRQRTALRNGAPRDPRRR